MSTAAKTPRGPGAATPRTKPTPRVVGPGAPGAKRSSTGATGKAAAPAAARPTTPPRVRPSSPGRPKSPGRTSITGGGRSSTGTSGAGGGAGRPNSPGRPQSAGRGRPTTRGSSGAGAGAAGAKKANFAKAGKVVGASKKVVDNLSASFKSLKLPKNQKRQPREPTPVPHPEPYCGTQLERDEIHCVLEKELFLSNYRGAGDKESLLKLGVGHVLCVNGTAEECNEHPDTFTYFNIDIDDDEDADIGSHIADALSFIEAAKKKGSGVVVHCAAGISRSATMVLAYLIVKKKMNMRKAFFYLLTKRPCIWPNVGFMKKLRVLDEEVFGHSDFEIADFEKWQEF